ncbi:MAG TPA: hypothetical protein VH478_01200 [Trebonia sp.]|nr:hypothetical protein [Trebonia sp.]
MRHFAPGNPTEEADTPGSLPWVILSRVGVRDELCVGISVQTPTPDKDGTGRPISHTQYFCVRYRDLTASAVSYQGLYSAVESQKLPGAGLQPVQLSVPCLDPAGLARTVRAAGAATVAAAAAMLLAGPVTITGPGLPDMPARLRFLDAVAALLPYGYRAHLAGTTWSDGAAGDRFRIAFSSRAHDEASRVAWASVPRPPADGPARAYLDLLTPVIGAEGGDYDPLESLIAHLAAEQEPHKFDDPAFAIRVLRAFSLPRLLEAPGAAERAPEADVRLLFTTGRIRELSPGGRVRVARRLVSFADQQDIPLLSKRSAELGEGASAELIDDIADACRRRLSQGSSALALDYLRYAEPSNLADKLLAELIRSSSRSADPLLALQAVGELLNMLVARTLVVAAYQETRRAVEENAAAAAALLYQAITQAGGGSFEHAAAWARSVASPLVPPFEQVVRGGRHAAEAGMLDGMSRLGHRESVRLLLLAAAHLRRHALVLPGFTIWLASRRLADGPFPEADRRYWDDAIRDLASADGEGIAWCDLARLVIGNGPQALLSGQYEQLKLSQGLAAAWREVTSAVDSRHAAGAGIDAVLEASLMAALRRENWRSEPALADAVRVLTRQLGDRPHLLAVVLDPREALQHMPRDASPAAIGEVCARAYMATIGPREGVERLRESGAVATGKRAMQVMEAVFAALQRIRSSGDTPDRWAAELVQSFTLGRYGPQVASEFPLVATERYVDNIRFRVRFLAILAEATTPDGAPAVDTAMIEMLDGCRKDIEDVIKAAKKRQPRGGWFAGFGGHGSDPDPGTQPVAGGQPGQGGQLPPPGPPAQSGSQ